jgi:putative zinc finger/helix-turn-helix YgiT family protein
MLKKRKSIKTFRGEEVEYNESYYINTDTNEEVYFRSAERENSKELVEAYKKKVNLLTSKDIKEIRKKYKLTQREYSFALGLGEITVHRFEKGSIQSDADNQLMMLSSNPEHFINMLDDNKERFTKERYVKIRKELLEKIALKEHQVVQFDFEEIRKNKIVMTDIEDLVVYIVTNYNESTIDGTTINKYKLHKVLYFLQGLTLYIYKRPAFNEDIYTSKIGPYVKRLKTKYGGNEVNVEKEKVYLNLGIHKLLDLIIEAYGKYDSSYLCKLSLEEFEFNGREEKITNDQLKNYFTKVYEQQ